MPMECPTTLEGTEGPKGVEAAIPYIVEHVKIYVYNFFIHFSIYDAAK